MSYERSDYVREERQPDGSIRVTVFDPRHVAGELLCPQRFDEIAVAALETDLGQFAPAQLQQDPVLSGGGTFKQWMIQYWSPPDTRGEPTIPGTVALPRCSTQVQSWDCAFKDTNASDYVVGQLWGREAAKFYLLDMVRGQWDFGRTCDEILLFSAKHPRVIKKYIEEKANGAAVISTFKEKLPGIEPVDPEGGKEARANAIQGLWGVEVRRGDLIEKRLGCVYIPHPSIAPWVADFVFELIRFPKGVKDDQVDAMTQALLKLYTGIPKLVEAMRALKKS